MYVNIDFLQDGMKLQLICVPLNLASTSPHTLSFDKKGCYALGNPPAVPIALQTLNENG